MQMLNVAMTTRIYIPQPWLSHRLPEVVLKEGIISVCSLLCGNIVSRQPSTEYRVTDTKGIHLVVLERLVHVLVTSEDTCVVLQVVPDMFQLLPRVEPFTSVGDINKDVNTIDS